MRIFFYPPQMRFFYPRDFWRKFSRPGGGWPDAEKNYQPNQGQNVLTQARDGPWPSPTRAYFWPAVNKRLTRLRPGYFPTQSNFFWPEGKKIEKFDIFRGNFWNSNPNHKWLTRSEPQKIDPTRPDPSQKFWPGPITNPDPSLLFCISFLKDCSSASPS